VARRTPLLSYEKATCLRVKERRLRFLIQGILYLGMGISLSGCLYSNKCGVSTYLYDDKEAYYDSQGTYREKCPPNNVMNYRDLGVKGAE